MNKYFTWKKYHRWFGLVLSVFMLVFCVSGIILNHRQLFADCAVSRSLLPPAYHIRNFNNGIIKGSTPSPLGILAYGYAGVWLTDSNMQNWEDFNRGLPEQIDERNIRHLVCTKDGRIWCAALRDVYYFEAGKAKRNDVHGKNENGKNALGGRWIKFPLPGNHERMADITLTPDSMNVIALTRSAIFEITTHKKSDSFAKIQSAHSENSFYTKRSIIAQPNGFIPTESLFKTVWALHSGAFFGLTGRLVVDAIAVVLIILSLTGIVLFILPYRIRRQKRLLANGLKDKKLKESELNPTEIKERMKVLGKRMVWNAKWHNKIGYTTIILTLWLAITGMCLRPPLMIPLALNKTEQKIKDGNVWHDKLRAIRWNAAENNWLVSTSEGFLYVDKSFSQKPRLLDKNQTPKVSPMGVNVFESDGKGGWLIGSFSGLFRWYPEQELILDYSTGKPHHDNSMIPISSTLTSGFSKDFFGGRAVVFDYSKGADIPVSTPELLSRTPLSLWNVALELHVGRCYSPLLGPLSDLFVFISGLLISLVLISGYIILHRRKKKKSKNKE